VVETAPSWFGDVLEEFLKAQARIGHTPGRASPHAQAAARDLAASRGQATADALLQAGYDIALTHLAPEAIVYFQASLEIFEALWKANPENVGIGDGLGTALSNLGTLLGDAGQVAEAEPGLPPRRRDPRGAVEGQPRERRRRRRPGPDAEQPGQPAERGRSGGGGRAGLPP